MEFDFKVEGPSALKMNIWQKDSFWRSPCFLTLTMVETFQMFKILESRQPLGFRQWPMEDQKHTIIPLRYKNFWTQYCNTWIILLWFGLLWTSYCSDCYSISEQHFQNASGEVNADSQLDVDRSTSTLETPIRTAQNPKHFRVEIIFPSK